MDCKHQFHIVENIYGFGQTQVCKFCGIDAWTYQNPGKLHPSAVAGISPQRQQDVENIFPKPHKP